MVSSRLVLALMVGCSLVLLSSGLAADEAEDAAARAVETKAQSLAVRGLAWLKSHQQADGSLGTKGYGQSAAVASLAGQAFLMSAGKEPADDYREPYEKCLSYVLEHVNEQGQVQEPKGSIGSTMYNQAYVTTFLAHAYRYNKQEKTLARLKQVAGVILESQNDEGAWRYQLKKADGDSSVTACAVVALRAAKEAGVEVPQEAFDKSLAYLRKLQNEDGGFGYTMAGTGSAFPRSAVAAFALSAVGEKEHQAAEKARNYLLRFQPTDKAASSGFFLHGHLYTVQLMCGDSNSNIKSGQEWRSALVRELARQQKEGGEWTDTFLGPEYATATACVILYWKKAGGE